MSEDIHRLFVLPPGQGWLVLDHGTAPEPDGCPVQRYFSETRGPMPRPGHYLIKSLGPDQVRYQRTEPVPVTTAAALKFLQELVQTLIPAER